MTLSDDTELANTRAKLKLLEEQLAANEHCQKGRDRARELSAHSLRRMITQLKEEITRFEIRQRQNVRSA